MALRAVTGHPKFMRLKALLKIPTYQALGILETLWHFTGRFTPQGNIGKYDDADIEAWVDWDGAEGALIEALVKAKWLYRSDEYRLIVHDWHEHADDATRLQLKRQNVDFVTKSKECRDSVGIVSGQRGDSVATVSGQRRDSVGTVSGLPVAVPVPEPEPVVPRSDSAACAAPLEEDFGDGGLAEEKEAAPSCPPQKQTKAESLKSDISDANYSPPDSPWGDLVCFAREWESRQKAPYPLTAVGRDLRDFKRARDGLQDPAQVRALIPLFFSTADAFLQGKGFTVSDFVGRIQALLPRLRVKARVVEVEVEQPDTEHCVMVYLPLKDAKPPGSVLGGWEVDPEDLDWHRENQSGSDMAEIEKQLEEWRSGFGRASRKRSAERRNKELMEAAK